MSDLQIGLMILGLFVIGGVVGFNWFQEKKFRQRAEYGFKRPDADVLLGSDEPPALASDEEWETRIDPHLEPRLETVATEDNTPTETQPEPPPAAKPPAARLSLRPDAAIRRPLYQSAGPVAPATSRQPR